MSTEAAPAGPVTFGRYTLLERLAVGGMAEVFRAKISSSHGFEKILVVKRILPHLAADPGFVTMFIDEAKLTAQLTHPKIVQILDFGEVNGQYFTALEFIDGFDALGLLRIAAQKKMRVPPALAVFIVEEMLEALDYAHNARDMEGKPMQIVHRDISPSNIFISRRGDVKLGDFGIAHAKRRESKTQAGTLKGKYGYMSPEQVVGRPIDDAQRSLRRGHRAGRAAHGAAALLGTRRSGRAAQGARRAPRSARQVRRGHSARARSRSCGGAEEGSGRAAAERVRAARRARRLPLLHRQTGGTDRPARLHGQAARRRPRHGRAGPAVRPAYRKAAARRDAPAGAQGSALVPTPTAADAGVPTVSRAPTPRRRPADRRPPPPTSRGTTTTSSIRRRAASRRSRVPGEGGGTTGRTGVRGQTKSDVGRFVSAAPKRPPDSAGEISVITPMRFFCGLALANETGLLRFEFGGSQKEIFLVGGAPESVNSSDPGERFGEYLVGRGILGPPDLELALSMLPHYNGKLGDTLVALGMLRPLDVFRLLSEQVRDRVIDVFAWTEGTFAFYRGVANRQESFPLGLDTFEILGAGVVSMPAALLEGRFEPIGDLRPVATGRARVEPEAFKIGPTPRAVLEMLDGERTVRGLLDEFGDPEERLTFLRSLYLLVETDLAELD